MPFTTKTVTSLAMTLLLPVAPLVLTMFSVEQLIDRVLENAIVTASAPLTANANDPIRRVP